MLVDRPNPAEAVQAKRPHSALDRKKNVGYELSRLGLGEEVPVERVEAEPDRPAEAGSSGIRT